jgi:hypothetical protein
MARFVLGLILGIFVGALAVSYNPSLSDGVRAALANLTALVATGAEKAAESVDRGANKLADQAERAKQGAAGKAEEPAAAEPAPR